MLMPKRVKHRKQFRGRMKGTAHRGNFVSNGDIGLMAMEPCWVTSQQIEAARIALTRYTKRGGQVWIKIFPDKPVTEKPAETRMGSGKGTPEYWVAVVKPGRVLFEIGGIEDLRADVEKFLGHAANIRVMDVKNPDADAQLIAENIAQQLEKRIAFRRAMKKAIQSAMKANAQGVKVSISGRVGGADIARTEQYHEGSIPLQTLRANIDYGVAEAKTTYGRLGVKVWVYKGQILPKAKKPAQPAPAIEGGK